MIIRKALIIGSPDHKIPGVNIDTKSLEKFLKSPIGGLWRDDEITTLTSPSAEKIKTYVESLKNKDYSLIFFAGHGYHSIERNRTILHINSHETFDSTQLRIGAPKHLLILDCCRKPASEQRLLKAAMESMTFDSVRGQTPNPEECRKYFTKEISDCDPGLVVMNSCSINQTAGESESEGGYYTSSLINSANEWAKEKLIAIDLTKEYSTYSTQACHDTATTTVKILSGDRQIPTFESPRSQKKFPFAVVA